MNNENIFNTINEKIKNKEFTSKDELANYLTNLKDRGILTQAQINLKYSEILNSYVGKMNNESNRMMSRTPQRNDLKTNESAGFSNMNFLVLNLLTASLAVATIVLLNK